MITHCEVPVKMKRVCELEKGDVFILYNLPRKVTSVNGRITYCGANDNESKTGVRGSFGLNNQMKVEVIE